MFDHPTILGYLTEFRQAEDLRQRRATPRSKRHRFAFWRLATSETSLSRTVAGSRIPAGCHAARASTNAVR